MLGSHKEDTTPKVSLYYDLAVLQFDSILALNKDNQDAYIICPQLGTSKDQAYFAIYDGHGKDGHHCARYARDHVRFLSLLYVE